MIINHNMNALNAHRQMMGNTAASGKSMEKLSSGLRINRAGDDAAGLAISEKMRGQIRGLDQASRNAQDGISLIQTAEGALNETHSILQRMRELAVQSSNDTTTDADRANIQKEVNQLSDEINRIGNSTEFNTKKLINGDVSTNIAEGAKLTGGDLGSSVKLINAATNGKATGTSITGAVNIHADTNGYATGSKALDDTTLGTTNLVIDGTNNELTLTAGSTQKTIVLTQKTYDGATAGQTSANLIADINTQLDAAFGAGNVVASLDGGKLKLTDMTSAGANSKVTIEGGNAISSIVGTATYSNGTVANDTLTYSVDGNAKSITLAKKVYNTVDDLISELNGAANANVAVNGGTFSKDGNALVFTSSTTGSTSKATNFGGSAAADLKLVGATATDGQDKNDQFEIDINGTKKTATVAAAEYTDMDVYAAAVQSAINTAFSGTGESVKVTNSNGNLTIADAKTGSTSSITLTDGTGATADLIAGAKALGFTSSTAANTSDTGINGSDKALKMQIGANKNQEMAVSINDMRAAALGITNADASTAGVNAEDGTTLDVNYSNSNKVTNNGATEYVLNVSTHDAAKNAISVVDNAIAKVSSERSNLGAYQNRLEHTIANLGTSSENLTSAESRIRDVDMAKEMMNFSKNNILSQAAQAMLAQANNQPQGVLQLLR